jgi:hypothetical protein
VPWQSAHAQTDNVALTAFLRRSGKHFLSRVLNIADAQSLVTTAAMKYLLAIVLPPVGLLLAGKPFQTLLSIPVRSVLPVLD